MATPALLDYFTLLHRAGVRRCLWKARKDLRILFAIVWPLKVRMLWAKFQRRSFSSRDCHITPFPADVERVPGLFALHYPESHEALFHSAQKLLQDQGLIYAVIPPGMDPALAASRLRLEPYRTLARAAVALGDSSYASVLRVTLDRWCHLFYQGWLFPGDALEWAKRLKVLRECLALFPRDFWGEELLGKITGVITWVTRFLPRHFSYHAPGNHIIGEVTAVLLGGEPGAKNWERARELFEKEILAQFGADGVHRELATTYHQWVLWDALEAQQELRRVGRPLGAVAEAKLRLALEALAVLMRPDGKLFSLGDSDEGDPPFPASDLLWFGRAVFGDGVPAPEVAPGGEVFWRTGRLPEELAPEELPAAPPSRFLAESGLLAARKGPSFALWDTGPFGYDASPAHGHADALSLNLFAHGRPMLADPGRFTYLAGFPREYFRGTPAHNTVTVDGGNQSVMWDRFRVGRTPQPTMLMRHLGQHFDAGCAEIKGAFPERGGWITHRRTIVLLPEGATLVLDSFPNQATAEREWAWWWHLTPCRMTFFPGFIGAVAHFDDGPCLLILPLFQEGLEQDRFEGAEHGPGWLSPKYGNLVEAPALAFYRTGPPRPQATLVVPMAVPWDGKEMRAAWEWESERPAVLSIEAGPLKGVLWAAELEEFLAAGGSTEPGVSWADSSTPGELRVFSWHTHKVPLGGGRILEVPVATSPLEQVVE